MPTVEELLPSITALGEKVAKLEDLPNKLEEKIRSLTANIQTILKDHGESQNDYVVIVNNLLKDAKKETDAKLAKLEDLITKKLEVPAEDVPDYNHDGKIDLFEKIRYNFFDKVIDKIQKNALFSNLIMAVFLVIALFF